MVPGSNRLPVVRKEAKGGERPAPGRRSEEWAREGVGRVRARREGVGRVRARREGEEPEGAGGKGLERMRGRKQEDSRTMKASGGEGGGWK